MKNAKILLFTMLMLLVVLLNIEHASFALDFAEERTETIREFWESNQSNAIDVLENWEDGQFIGLDTEVYNGQTFSRNDYIVATYFFYWYDLIGSFDKNTYSQLPDYDDEDFTSQGEKGVDWSISEVQEMVNAGIDLILPVHWGPTNYRGIKEYQAEYDTIPRSISGHSLGFIAAAENLNAAMEELYPPNEPALVDMPLIAMFFDTTTLAGIEDKANINSGNPVAQTNLSVNDDLVLPGIVSGKQQFYQSIKEFYSRINPKYWARIDDNGTVKIIVWLYVPQHMGSEAIGFDFAKQQFATDFGGLDLFFVGAAGFNHDWDFNGDHDPVGSRYDLAEIDLENRWSISGGPMSAAYDISTVSPGFDNQYRGNNISWASANGYRLYLTRLGGAKYLNDWNSVHATKNDTTENFNRIVVLETWNELFEASGIAKTRAFPDESDPDFIWEDAFFDDTEQDHRYLSYFDEGVNSTIWNSWVGTGHFRGNVTVANGTVVSSTAPWEGYRYVNGDYVAPASTYPTGLDGSVYNSSTYGNFYYDQTIPNANRHRFPGHFADRLALFYEARALDHDSSEYFDLSENLDRSETDSPDLLTVAGLRDEFLNQAPVSNELYMHYLWWVYHGYAPRYGEDDFEYHLARLNAQTDTRSELRDNENYYGGIDATYTGNAVWQILRRAPLTGEASYLAGLGKNRNELRDYLLNSEHVYSGVEWRFDTTAPFYNAQEVFDFHGDAHPVVSCDCDYDGFSYQDFVYLTYLDEFQAEPPIDIYYEYLVRLYAGLTAPEALAGQLEQLIKPYAVEFQNASSRPVVASFENGDLRQDGVIEDQQELEANDAGNEDFVIYGDDDSIMAIVDGGGPTQGRIRIKGELIGSPPANAAFQVLDDADGEVLLALEEGSGDLYIKGDTFDELGLPFTPDPSP